MKQFKIKKNSFNNTIIHCLSLPHEPLPKPHSYILQQIIMP